MIESIIKKKIKVLKMNRSTMSSTNKIHVFENIGNNKLRKIDSISSRYISNIFLKKIDTHFCA